ncbi:Protein CapL [Georgfuchsia toluolica]|uniref:Protein CapL n=1 Tax=Georgfuchsia toluolica TaxID=424218 RepID=A0A916J3U6_9PROT|nr:Protein CapL [Georgfuchsia toluolica]
MRFVPEETDLALPEKSDAAASVRLATVGVVGLGYVGLPVAVAFGRNQPTVGYDMSAAKVDSLAHRIDRSGEVSSEELAQAEHLHISADPTHLSRADFVIVAVPTPVDAAHQPDFTPLELASETVGRNLKPGATVIYESTVYPGATEEVCVPILEKYSGMRWHSDFHVAYSPERIDPGNEEHTFTRIRKVVSGDDAATLEKVAELYASVVTAGVYRAPSIRVAEAAKVIENTQRDLNIALVNELAIIFDRLGIDTMEVLRAAGTKWNFLHFTPGLVGGHCIGVDPFYLTYKAELSGYHPEVILAGRRINDGMGAFVARKTVQQMIHAGRNIKGARVNVLGLTFKENCADIRNSKVVDIIRELGEFGVEIFVHDPKADPDAALREYGIRLCSWERLPAADALILAVSHSSFLDLSAADLMTKIVHHGCLIDVKSVVEPAPFCQEGVHVWRL